jgi:hypothetical protein
MNRSEYPEEADAIPFALARTKLLRAHHFIEELEADQAEYASSKPVSIEPVFVDGVQVGMNLKQTAATLLPGAIAADAIHSLRTALDLIASELARRKGESDKHVYFPFGTDEAHFEGQIVRKNFHLAGDDAVALLRTFKPYATGNAELRALHDLDIQDKHRGLRLSASKYAVGRFRDDGQSFEFFDHIQDFHYMFPETAGGLDGKGSIEALKDLAQMVEGILDAFLALVAARK